MAPFPLAAERTVVGLSPIDWSAFRSRWGPASALRRVDILSRDLDLPRWRHLIGEDGSRRRLTPGCSSLPPTAFWLTPTQMCASLPTLASFSVFSRSSSARIFSPCLPRSICCNTLLCFSASAIRHGMDILATGLLAFFRRNCVLVVHIFPVNGFRFDLGNVRNDEVLGLRVFCSGVFLCRR